MTANKTTRLEPAKVMRLRVGARELLCDLRQWQYPLEFRIVRPPAPMPEVAVSPQGAVTPAVFDVPVTPAVTTTPAEDPAEREQAARLDRAIAKVTVCLWDIRRKLEGSDVVSQDRKLRLLVRRAEAAVTALEDIGVSIDDPIGKLYPPGSEGSMNPSFLPTPEATEERIVETVAPIVYRDHRLIGRGDVFVAMPVPIEPEPGEVKEEGGVAADSIVTDEVVRIDGPVNEIPVSETPGALGDQSSTQKPFDESAAEPRTQDPKIDPVHNEGH